MSRVDHDVGVAVGNLAGLVAVLVGFDLTVNVGAGVGGSVGVLAVVLGGVLAVLAARFVIVLAILACLRWPVWFVLAVLFVVIVVGVVLFLTTWVGVGSGEASILLGSIVVGVVGILIFVVTDGYRHLPVGAFRVAGRLIPARCRGRYLEEWRAELEAMADRSRIQRARWLASLILFGIPKMAIVLRFSAWLGG